jgi:hypothetical protein
MCARVHVQQLILPTMVSRAAHGLLESWALKRRHAPARILDI